MSAKRVVRIGQEVFVLSHDGEVVRTMVGELEEDGYRFLDGSSNRRPHWFVFKDAVAAASAHISARQATLRKTLRALAHKRRTFETENYQDGVMNEPYKVVDLQDAMSWAFSRSRRSRKLKKIRVPETYLTPGHMVYVIITPTTHSKSEKYTYRPHKHFILETAVKSVCFSPDGQAHYTFSTPLIVEEFFPSRKAAAIVAKLQGFPGLEAKDLIPFVSSKQEKEEIAKIPDDIPF